MHAAETTSDGRRWVRVCLAFVRCLPLATSDGRRRGGAVRHGLPREGCALLSRPLRVTAGGEGGAFLSRRGFQRCLSRHLRSPVMAVGRYDFRVPRHTIRRCGELGEASAEVKSDDSRNSAVRTPVVRSAKEDDAHFFISMIMRRSRCGSETNGKVGLVVRPHRAIRVCGRFGQGTWT